MTCLNVGRMKKRFQAIKLGRSKTVVATVGNLFRSESVREKQKKKKTATNKKKESDAEESKKRK